jgi:hypothetical protein
VTKIGDGRGCGMDGAQFGMGMAKLGIDVAKFQTAMAKLGLWLTNLVKHAKISWRQLPFGNNCIPDTGCKRYT